MFLDVFGFSRSLTGLMIFSLVLVGNSELRASESKLSNESAGAHSFWTSCAGKIINGIRTETSSDMGLEKFLGITPDKQRQIIHDLTRSERAHPHWPAWIAEVADHSMPVVKQEAAGVMKRWLDDHPAETASEAATIPIVNSLVSSTNHFRFSEDVQEALALRVAALLQRPTTKARATKWTETLVDSAYFATYLKHFLLEELRRSDGNFEVNRRVVPRMNSHDLLTTGQLRWLNAEEWKSMVGGMEAVISPNSTTDAIRENGMRTVIGLMQTRILRGGANEFERTPKEIEIFERFKDYVGIDSKRAQLPITYRLLLWKYFDLMATQKERRLQLLEVDLHDPTRSAAALEELMKDVKLHLDSGGGPAFEILQADLFNSVMDSFGMEAVAHVQPLKRNILKAFVELRKQLPPEVKAEEAGFAFSLNHAIRSAYQANLKWIRIRMDDELQLFISPEADGIKSGLRHMLLSIDGYKSRDPDFSPDTFIEVLKAYLTERARLKLPVSLPLLGAHSNVDPEILIQGWHELGSQPSTNYPDHLAIYYDVLTLWSKSQGERAEQARQLIGFYKLHRELIP